MCCSYCGSRAHTIENCPKTWSGSSNRLHMRCSYCGSHEHNVKACPKTWNGNAARVWYPDSVAKHFIKDYYAS